MTKTLITTLEGGLLAGSLPASGAISALERLSNNGIEIWVWEKAQAKPEASFIIQIIENEGIALKSANAAHLPVQSIAVYSSAVPAELLDALPDSEIYSPGLVSWQQLAAELTAPAPRTGSVHRTTSETDIRIEVNLDGSGRASIHTGLGFFDHMLDQLARHGGIDLTIQVKGDLHIDEHHTIEDTALALGEAMLKAMGTRRGMERYGFLLPMDDCLAQVAIDFGGRPWLVWEATFQREKIGDMPTEMFMHFFKSFSDTAKCNLNIQASGDNEHHKIESIFKGWARAIKMAIRRDTASNDIPSTKGVL